MTLSIGGVQIGEGYPCRFAVEISNAHNGDLSRAHRLIDTAKATGAELVKLQAFTVDELCLLRGEGPAPAPWDHLSIRELYARAETPLGWLPELFQHARDIGLVPFSSVFGLESLAALERISCDAYKVARIDNHQLDHIDAVITRRKPVIVSSNDKLSFGRSDDDVHVLYCAPEYPTPRNLVKLPDSLGCTGARWSPYIGLSSHCMDPLLPIAAVARGAHLIEMHMMLAEEPSELESNVSLDQYRFAQMVRDVRRVEEMLG